MPPDRDASSDRPTTDEELLAIVDNNDEVTGRATRREVHAGGLLHRAVHIIVLNGRGEIFVQQRATSKDNSPGLWDTAAAGHVDFGEDYDECARRELNEELGLRDVPIERVGYIHACAATDQEFVRLYRTTTDQALQLNHEEIQDGRWCALPVLEGWMTVQPALFTAAFHLIFDRYHVNFQR